MIDLFIIIVSFNTKDILQKCLESVFANLSKQYTHEVIVVDNDSKDASVAMVNKDFSEVMLLENRENVGFSKANNQGIKKAKGRYVLFLNSDTVVFEHSIETMIKFMEDHAEAGAATCRVELLNGKFDDAAHRGFPTPWNSFCHFSGLSKIFSKSKLFSGYSLGWMDMSQTHEIDACAGAFMLVRKEAGEQVGWWDEDFFWYGDDLDFCYRLKEKGWKIFFVPTVSILHYKGVSGGIKKHSENISTANAETKKLATKARFDAMKIFYKKHYQKQYPKIITILIFAAIDFMLRNAIKK